jgi:hypothetical protein
VIARGGLDGGVAIVVLEGAVDEGDVHAEGGADVGGGAGWGAAY